MTHDPSSSAAAGIAAWVRSEAGGWSIISALVVVLLAAGGVAVVGPRGTIDQGLEAASGTASEIQADPAVLALAPDTVRDLSPAAARAWNAALAFSMAPNPAARPFFAPSADVRDYGRALDCLTAALYYEAGSETAAGQAAVAQAVLNRVRHPAYPRTVCGVVFQGSERATGCQFTFACEGSMGRSPSPAGWGRSRVVATAALNGRVMAQVGTATHYHTDAVAPFWAPRLAKIVQIQTHIFYRWNGAWGLPSAFVVDYIGGEPEIARMVALSTITLEAPATGLILSDPAPDPFSHQPVIQSAILPVVVPEPASLILDTADDRREPTPDAAIAPPAARREVAAAPDPRINAGAAPPQRQRSRIATPSGW